MSETLTFGPENDQWVYNRASKTYDLTRSPNDSHGFTIRTTHGPADTRIRIAPARSALIVVDMQNFFLHPRCNEHPSGLAAVDRTLEVIAKCRALGIQIIWLNWGLTDDDLATMPAAAQRSFSRDLLLPPSAALDDDDAAPPRSARRGFGSDMGGGRGRLLMRGSWNAQLYGPLLTAAAACEADADADADVRCDKDRISGLWRGGTALGQALRGPGPLSATSSLLFAGVNSDQCVAGTLADACWRGYDCVLLEDCCATTTPGGQEVTVYNTARGYGFVTDSKNFCDGKLVAETGT
ncbi:isochorismatase [Xylariomycetidae sp. FL0641]|nr:isochorismatase [Xylariomycetidae sp. FL0641]